MASSRADVGRSLRAAVVLGVWALAHASPAAAQAGPAAQEGVPPITGEIASLTLDQGADAERGGTIVVSGVRVAIPAGLIIELPSVEVTLPWLFRQAPARCRERGESGVAKNDTCRVEVDAPTGGARPATDAPPRDSGSRAAPPPPPAVSEVPPAMATVALTRDEDGRLVAAALRMTRNLEQLMGGVTFINPDEGYIRINGYYRQDVGGTMVRVNDPLAQHGDQHGAACGSEANCSSDPRFRVGSSSYTVLFEQGNPACIGAELQGCYASDRKLARDDASVRIPVVVGDNVTVYGAFEIAGGLRYFSAQAMVVQANLEGGR